MPVFVLSIAAGCFLLSEPAHAERTNHKIQGLRFQTPASFSFLRGEQAPSSRLAHTLSKNRKKPQTSNHAFVLNKAADVDLEVWITPRPEPQNWQVVVQLRRASRYGSEYSFLESRALDINTLRWTRTRYRVGHDSREAIEYSIAKGENLYTVTIHGPQKRLPKIDQLMRASLRFE